MVGSGRRWIIAGGITKGYKETWDDGQVHYLDCSKSFKIYQMAHFKYVQFIVLQLLPPHDKASSSLWENKRSPRNTEWTAIANYPISD